MGRGTAGSASGGGVSTMLHGPKSTEKRIIVATGPSRIRNGIAGTAFGVRQDGLVELGQQKRWRGRAAVSNWSRPAAPPRRCAMRGSRSRHLRSHRLSRDDGRARQDAASQGAWRPARGARQCRACRRDDRARHRADRPRGGQPLSLRADGGQGRGPRRDHREYRHRRPVDGPLRGEEPRRSSRS
jgi:hypothetical protein